MVKAFAMAALTLAIYFAFAWYFGTVESLSVHSLGRRYFEGVSTSIVVFCGFVFIFFLDDFNTFAAWVIAVFTPFGSVCSWFLFRVSDEMPLGPLGGFLFLPSFSLLLVGILSDYVVRKEKDDQYISFMLLSDKGYVLKEVSYRKVFLVYLVEVASISIPIFLHLRSLR